MTYLEKLTIMLDRDEDPLEKAQMHCPEHYFPGALRSEECAERINLRGEEKK